MSQAMKEAVEKELMNKGDLVLTLYPCSILEVLEKKHSNKIIEGCNIC